MSSQKLSKSFKKRQYALKAYVDQVNPQFLGIAKKHAYFKKAKEQAKIQNNKIYNEVTHIQKLNEKLDKIIKKKKQQVQRSRQIRNRYIEQKKNKQKNQIFKQRQLQLKKSKSFESKKNLQHGTIRAKIQYDMIRKQIANMTKKQKRILKTEKTKTQIDQWSKSRLKVQQIEESKTKGKQLRNQFYRKRNSSFLMRYQTQIQKSTESLEQDKSRASSLSIKRQFLLNNCEIRKQALQQLNKSLLLNKKNFKEVQSYSFLTQHKSSALNTQVSRNSKKSLF